ncbi:hypothetical protein KKF84_22220 [Myxococcota bacterium]|nr:hypothetical protein [Myxococcota bacterium]
MDSYKLRKNCVMYSLLIGVCGFAAISCKNVDQFQGNWKGEVSQSRLVRRGVDFCSSMELTIDSVDSASLTARFQFVTKEGATVCSNDVTGDGTVLALPSSVVELELDSQFLNDSLSGMTLEEEPLFTHLAHGTLPAPWGDEPVIVFLSYYMGPKIRVRVVSRNIFAVFRLNRLK